MNKNLHFISRKAGDLRHSWRYIRHKGIAKIAAIIKKRLYCKISSYPNSFMIEAASKCNLACPMCWAYKANEYRRNSFLKYQDFQKIIDDIDSFCSKIFFSFCGEPLLNSDIYKMIAYAEEKNMAVGLSTNATLLTEDHAINLLDANIDEIVVSLDAATEGTYESMRTGRDFYKVINGVKFLIEEKHKRRLIAPMVILQMVLTKKNESEINEFVRLAREIKADKVTIKSLFIDHHGSSGYIDKLITEYYLPDHHVSRYKQDADGTIKLKKKGSCPNNRSPVISSDGDVCVCCFDILGEYKQGNAINDSFRNLWNRPGYRHFRKESMLNRKLPMCRVCAYSNVPEINIPLN